MKKKYKIVIMIAISILILIIISLYGYKVRYKTYSLICVGEIKINNNAQIRGGFYRCFARCDRYQLEDFLRDEIEEYPDYYVISQQEFDNLIDTVNQYGGYPTVILSRIRSNEFFTNRKNPHVGYMYLGQPYNPEYDSYSIERLDDVIYVYVTKCTEISSVPESWICGCDAPPLFW